MKPETAYVLWLSFGWRYTIQWAPYTHSTPVKNMSVNHRGFYIFVAKQFLNGANVVATFQ